MPFRAVTHSHLQPALPLAYLKLVAFNSTNALYRSNSNLHCNNKFQIHFARTVLLICTFSGVPLGLSNLYHLFGRIFSSLRLRFGDFELTDLVESDKTSTSTHDLYEARKRL